MVSSRLSPDSVEKILHHLNVPAVAPTLSLLAALVNAYIRTVPWETASRIVKRNRTKETAVSPRWPEEFWNDNLELGCGGTCFESNYAFFSLLQTLGFAGYLTINNMGDSIGCHTAIILLLEEQKWLVDAGFPLYAPLPINPKRASQRETRFMNYTIRPDGHNCYQIEQQPHPNKNAFTLIDQPVTDAAYRAATTADYGTNGLFLDRLVINKVVDEQTWRFNSAEAASGLMYFVDGVRTVVALHGDVATAVTRHFGIDKTIIQAAFQYLAI